MISKAVLTASAGVGVLLAAGAQAQGFAGGDLGIEVFALSEDDDIGHTTYFGAGEFDVTPAFGVAGSFASYRSNGITTDGNNLTLHGIFHWTRGTSFGLFLGRESTDDDDRDLIGIEARTDFQGLAVEGYVARAEGDDVVTILGANGSYELFNAVTLTGDLGYVDLDGDSYNRLSAGVEYPLAVGPTLYAELGRTGFPDNGETDSSTFVGIGARLDFGPANGTTFGRRGVFEAVPAF